MPQNPYDKIENEAAWLAWQCVTQTNVNIFLTGKAGTGKTTFLRELRNKSHKRMVVVAPTGVAAVNANGVTMHSFFQLPFQPYIPGTPANKEYRMRREKRAILRTLDLLVIDEISMVRADLLDAVDAALRHYRSSDLPFGGVQLLLIGDLQQLSPVVVESERYIIEQHYATPYFFSSLALQRTQLLTVELKRIYRQSDRIFVDVLNKIRNNAADSSALDILNSRYIPNFSTDEPGYICLTTHVNKADNINAEKLAALKSATMRYECETIGTFPAASYPADSTLELKVGAQVMFLKNDTSPEHRYYNGKIGRVTSLSRDEVTVECPDDDGSITVGMAEWSNTRYDIDKATNEITEVVDGTFKQIPLRLAWAITIHKSQGLTFDKAIIDAASSFAHGQVYVALSRCRTLEGLVLSTPITPDSVINDRTVAGFIEQSTSQTIDEQQLERLKLNYFVSLVEQTFSFRELLSYLYRTQRLFEENLDNIYPQLISDMYVNLQLAEKEIVAVGNTFAAQCRKLVAEGNDIRHDEAFIERINKGAAYFRTKASSLIKPILESTDVPIDNKEVKTQNTDLRNSALKAIYVKLSELKAITDNGFSTDVVLKARINAIIKSENSRIVMGEKEKAENSAESTTTEISNPGLYVKLLAWRKRTAADEECEDFMVLKLHTAQEISAALPVTKAQLAALSGIGKKKLQKYGEELIAIVREYVKEKGIDVNEADPAKKSKAKRAAGAKAKEKEEKVDTRDVSLQLFRDTNDIDKVAEMRGLKRSTIIDHLTAKARLGEITFEEVMGEEKYKALRLKIMEMGDTPINVICTRLVATDGYDYTMVRAVAQQINDN